MIVEFWGTRSGLALAEPAPRRYGGDTACLTVHTSDETFLFDCGTGAVACGVELTRRGIQRIGAFFSSHNWDRIQGLPFFSPMFSAAFQIRFCALDSAASSLEKVLQTQMSYDFFPISFYVFPAQIDFCTFTSASSSPQSLTQPASSRAKLSALPLGTQSSQVAYRLEVEGRTLVYAVKVAWDNSAFILEQLAPFCAGADLLITNLPSDLPSPTATAISPTFLELQRQAHLGQTIFSDFSPHWDDRAIAEYVERANAALASLSSAPRPLQAAHTNLKISL